MRVFKVLVIAHMIKSGRLIENGGLVNEDQLNGNADELVLGKFIEEVVSEKVIAPKKEVVSEEITEKAEKVEAVAPKKEVKPKAKKK
jgi:excinuclease UvrABC nuclease subunit